MLPVELARANTAMGFFVTVEGIGVDGAGGKVWVFSFNGTILLVLLLINANKREV